MATTPQPSSIFGSTRTIMWTLGDVLQTSVWPMKVGMQMFDNYNDPHTHFNNQDLWKSEVRHSRIWKGTKSNFWSDILEWEERIGYFTGWGDEDFPCLILPTKNLNVDILYLRWGADVVPLCCQRRLTSVVATSTFPEIQTGPTGEFDDTRRVQ